MRLERFYASDFALGSDVSFDVVSSRTAQEILIIFDKLWAKVFNFERSFSRFLIDSELSVFNRKAGLEVKVSPEFMKLLTLTQHLSRSTDGLYNPFILPALHRSGYIGSAAEGFENDLVDDYSSRSVATIDQLVLTGTTATIPMNCAIDLGGCGKGYLADLLRETIKGEELVGYRFNLGGDIATFGTDEHGHQWEVFIQSGSDISREHRLRITCPTTEFGIATSGTFKRPNQSSTPSSHHLIDPVSQKPSHTDIKLATVCAPTTTQSDVLASCAVLLGSHRAVTFLKKRAVLGALLQTTNQNCPEVVVTSEEADIFS